MTERLWGCGTALLTPFTRDGAVDTQALGALVDWQIEQGIHFLVPCGSTGEAVTLTPDEQIQVVRLVAERTAGRVPVMAGAGSNDTRRAVSVSRTMRDAGATHLLHVSPMYNKPPQRGIIEHFRAVADATELPVIVYNVPGRTSSNIEPRTTLVLSEIPHIAGVKEASGSLTQIQEILRERPPHFSVLSGDDALTLGVMAAGGDGVISVTSNAAPALMARLVNLCRAGSFEEARALHERLLPWMSAAFVESNPIPVKAALASMGKIENVLRLPLVPLDPTHETLLREALWMCGAL
jgi:4-hydroxy-tetrahydrodipicolinate synthase